MCGVCQGTERVSGRVDHTRWRDHPSMYSSASNSLPMECWDEGSIACPYCRPELYGRIRRVELRKE